MFFKKDELYIVYTHSILKRSDSRDEALLFTQEVAGIFTTKEKALEKIHNMDQDIDGKLYNYMTIDRYLKGDSNDYVFIDQILSTRNETITVES